MKVAKIIDNYTVAVTRDRLGTTPKVGDILGVGSVKIYDPENGEFLGALSRYGLKVTKVREQFLVAETYVLSSRDDPALIDVNVGDVVVFA